MVKLNEDISFYVSNSQREILYKLFQNKDINDNYFLTGGTALSVFYLYHRKSDDIDLFTLNDVNLPEIDFWIKRNWLSCSMSLYQFSTKNELKSLIKDIYKKFA
jgi:predicted nucleotidyltransferase component of viral defense system